MATVRTKTNKTTPIVTNPLLEKFQATEDSMNSRLVERSQLVRVLLVALVGKLDVFGLGEPGVAKTLSVTTLRDHISDLPEDAYFWRLLTKFSTPSELFGVPDLRAMEEGRWRLNTDGMMVDAKFVLLDEVFKANSAILNSLLTYMNEGIFHNDGIIEVDKWVVFGISNEMPQGEELNALYDRFDLRVIIERIQSSSGFVQMLKSQSLDPVVPTLTVADIEQAQREVRQVTVGDEVFDALLSLRKDLKNEGVEPTDRRFARCLAVVRASAWLRGAETAEIEDMRDLRHVLWTGREDKTTVDTMVLKLASPLDAEAMKLREEVDKLAETFDDVFRDDENKTARNKKAIELHSKLERATSDLHSLTAQLPKGRRSDIMEDVHSRLKQMSDTILIQVFGLDPNSKKVDADD